MNALRYGAARHSGPVLSSPERVSKGQAWRVSAVELYRRWLDDDDMDLDTFLARLRGEQEPSEAMLAGTAFHRVLELAAEIGDIDEVEAEGFRFTVAADIDLALPPIRELRASKTYLVDGEPIVVSGQVDALDGLRVIDHKTTARFDPERFLAGYQWRLYLDIFSAAVFRWNVFEMCEIGDRHYEIFAFHPLAQCRYPDMESDCERLVASFARFVRKHGARLEREELAIAA